MSLQATTLYITKDAQAPNIKRKPVGEIKIDLVKAVAQGLTLSQACTLSVVHQIIRNNLTQYVDIDDNRWWYITGRAISEYAPLVAAHAWTGAQNLIALSRTKLIELDEMQVNGEVWFVVKVNENLVLDSEDE
ncbi:hypothetical protein [Reinekea sp.]|jgi:hypothetical protein|uniref:hypothetical protein n=1 Tax=Reinekea sp. TaxID=1970455 RepID=UPI003989E310